MKNEKIDCVLAMGTYPGLVMALICKGLKVKTVFCDHGAIKNQLDDKIVTKYRKIAYKNTDKTVTLTERSMHNYIKYLKADNRKLEFVYNAIDDDIFSCVKPYNPENKVIMSCGRITKEKGFDMLIEVAKKVFQDKKDWVWKIYGDGNLYNEVSDKIKEYHLEKNVLMLGSTNEMYSKYSECGIFVLTSYREGLPLVLLEAKANNIPIVSFDIETGPAEIVRNGIDGYLIRPYEIEEMANKILELMQSTERRIEFSNNAVQNIGQFQSATIKQKWKKIIDSI